ncbi:hypothetical protein Tco_0951782 [Tanacetum coccineum]|uniref:Retrotransposon gag domain-containing protein n=1 Tax=Tanacetum coccineum TaxID=301880 RepID=A0ABQ5DXH1_9ASTR
MLESSSDFNSEAPVTTDRTVWMPPSGSTFEVGGPSFVSSLPPHLLGRKDKRLREDTKSIYCSVIVLEQGMRTHQTEIAATHFGVCRIERRMNTNDVEETYGFTGGGNVEARPSKTIDVLAVYGVSRPPGSRGSPDGPQTMPPRRLKHRAVESLVANRVAEAVAEYERNQANDGNARGAGPENAGGAGPENARGVGPENAGGAGTENIRGARPENARGSGPENARGAAAPEVQRCSFKTFLNCKPHSFNETEGVVRLTHWFEKMKSVFEISKCAKEDKVKFVVCTLKGSTLTWWNGNVHSLGITAMKKIPWSELKTMMTAEYCPGTEIQRMDKKIKRYVRGLLERVKWNVTSSKPANIHEAINIARELVEQAVQAKATRIRESKTRK